MLAVGLVYLLISAIKTVTMDWIIFWMSILIFMLLVFHEIFTKQLLTTQDFEIFGSVLLKLCFIEKIGKLSLENEVAWKSKVLGLFLQKIILKLLTFKQLRFLEMGFQWTSLGRKKRMVGKATGKNKFTEALDNIFSKKATVQKYPLQNAAS